MTMRVLAGAVCSIALLGAPAHAAPRSDPSLTAQAPEPRSERRDAPERDRDLENRRTQILGFIDDYYERASLEPDQAYGFLVEAYGPRVRYYGREASRREVLADKQRFLDRWPRREYRVRPDTAEIDCQDDVSSCSVSVLVDFVAEDPRSGRRSAGVTTSRLVIDLTGDRPVIVAESGEVTERD